MKLSSIKQDQEKSENGVWVPFTDGLKILIARAGNAECKKMTARLQKPLEKRIRKGLVEDSVLSDIAKKVTAKHIILDWENLEDDDGEEIPYSPEKAYELISDPENEIFYNWVLEASVDEMNFRKESKEDELGNSQAASNGS